jgi:hypothetical protein
MSEIESEEQLQPSGRDGVMLVRVGGRDYPAKQVKQCRTCRSKYRTQIEQGIIGGMTYRAILANLVDPFDDHSHLGAPSYTSIQRHVSQKHMPLPFSTQRKIIEDRAAELGKSVEEGEALLIDSISIHRSLIQKGFEDIWRDALMEYMSIVRRNVDATVLQRIGRELAESQILQQITQRRGQTVSGEIAS